MVEVVVMSLGPFDLPGAPFLALYCVLLAAAVAANLAIGRRRPQGCFVAVDDADEAAFMAGGKVRLTEAVVARLLALGAARIVNRKTFALAGHHPQRSAIERRMATLGPASWKDLEAAAASHAGTVERRLIANGLMLDVAPAIRFQLAVIAPYLALLVFGTVKLLVGLSRDRPVGYLGALMVVTALLAMLTCARLGRRSAGGEAALRDARRKAARLRLAPTGGEIGLAVALFVTGVLAGSAYADFHTLRVNNGGGGGGDGGCGGGGCGGGGCGGCGG